MAAQPFVYLQSDKYHCDASADLNYSVTNIHGLPLWTYPGREEDPVFPTGRSNDEEPCPQS